MTFEGTTLTLFLGHREIRLLHFGRGNTAGDVAVYVPDAKVVATGDLVVAPTPYAYGAYLGEWSEGLGKLAALDASHVRVLDERARGKIPIVRVSELGGDVHEENAALRFALGSGLSAALSHNVLRLAVSPGDASLRWRAAPVS